MREILTLSRAAAAHQFVLALALHQEASAFDPYNRCHRVRCGQMFGKAGDLISADTQSERAALDVPNAADPALQIGHRHKLAEQPALANYRRALALSPDWRGRMNG